MLGSVMMKCRSGASVRMTVSRAMSSKIIYTHTDEAPALATYALLPVLRRFTEPAGIEMELSDISVAGRILSHFPENLTADQKIGDELSVLGGMAKAGTANIIKLPNVSASVPQLTEAIAELQGKGYNIPNFPLVPANAEEQGIADRYAKVLGSAVNPVLREGNSDRRVAGPVKAYAQANPKKMGAWTPESKTEVAHMTDGDFFSSEQSAVMDGACSVKIEFTAADGTVTSLKEVPLEAGEVIDASSMNVSALRDFFATEIADAKDKDVLLSLHLKATMMKVSDPIMFGACVETYFKPAFDKHGDALAAAGANTHLGLGAVLDTVATMPNATEIEADFAACYENGPRLAMVDSRKGITNLHVPSDVIIDASMPNVIRDSGGMWNKDDALEDTKAMIPDRCYAGIYKKMVEFCKANGQFDAATMGNVANVGLMAQKAEEYGSHDKTHHIAADGTMTVSDAATGSQIFSHSVSKGDIWRMCQTKDAPIRDWVKLAVARARATGSPAVFWLNAERGHDSSMIAKVNEYLKDHDTAGLDITIQTPNDAIQFSMERCKAGQDTISVTGNVLRDYLTDLFPILELGTSAKMLSIVPMLAGGAMYETGAGGSAPKHVQQFVEEGHLRWDSLGEYLAMAVSLEDLGTQGDAKAALLSTTLTAATTKLLTSGKSPSRKVNELDNRGSSFYIAMYWAEAMAEHDESFKELATQLASNESKIVDELIACQGTPVDIGGYYMPDMEKTSLAMRPSSTLNDILASA